MAAAIGNLAKKPKNPGAIINKSGVGVPGAGKGTTAAEQRQAAQAALGPDIAPWIQHPRTFMQNVIKGHGPALARLAMLKQATGMLGYGKDQGAVSDELRSSLAAGAPVNLNQGERPTYDTRQNYLNTAIQRGQQTGDYLDPSVENAMRARGIEGVQGATSEAMGDESSRLAAAGIDPRSGVANQRALQIARLNQQGRSGVERDISDASAGRQQQLEGQAQQQAGLEESGRHFDTSAQQQRLSNVEGGLGSLGALGENQRQFDVDYTESQRQTELARIANQKAASALKPSDLEKWAGGVGGFFQGLGA